MFGRELRQPRLTAWYGDPGTHYRYSGLELTPKMWHPLLADLRVRLEQTLDVTFNSVLANAYRNGQDSMGWHSDNEPELGECPTIASVSLGANRRFSLRPKASGPSHSMVLENGSLLIMQGDCQARWKHALPKTAKPVGLRINLTFREIRLESGTQKPPD